MDKLVLLINMDKLLSLIRKNISTTREEITKGKKLQPQPTREDNLQHIHSSGFDIKNKYIRDKRYN